MFFLLAPDGHLPLPVTSQHLLSESFLDPPPGRSYPQLKLLSKNLLIKESEEATPDPSRYPSRPWLKPHPFMGLDKFDACRLQQIRSGKSYLRAHPSWDNDSPPPCPRCKEAPETFAHAILHCPAKQRARTRHLLGVLDMGPNAPVWSSAPSWGLSPSS